MWNCKLEIENYYKIRIYKRHFAIQLSCKKITFLPSVAPEFCIEEKYEVTVA